MVSPLRAVRPTNPAVCPQWTTGPGCISPLRWRATERTVVSAGFIFGMRQPVMAR